MIISCNVDKPFILYRKVKSKLPKTENYQGKLKRSTSDSLESDTPIDREKQGRFCHIEPNC